MRTASVNDLDAALQCIPADDRQTWVKIGMALKSELGESGFSLWDYWSQSAGNYQERAAQSVWRSFKPGSTKIGTLFHIAAEHGYRPGKPAQNRPIPTKKPPQESRNTAKYASDIWLKADQEEGCVRSHPYAINKGLDTDGGAGRATVTGKIVGKDADCIVIPIRDLTTDKVKAVQVINPEGQKQTFGSVSGNGLLLGNTLDTACRWHVVEGWASAVSLVFRHYQGNAAAGIAFGKSNMNRLAQVISDMYQPNVLRLLGECDDNKNH